MLPLLGWAAVAVGTAVIAAVASSSSTSSSSSSSTVSDRKKREDEAHEEAIEERNKEIKKDIKQYKKRQVKRFADNHGMDITFISKKDIVGGALGLNNAIALMNATTLGARAGKYKIKILIPDDTEVDSNPIESLEKENDELTQLIEMLGELKNESTG